MDGLGQVAGDENTGDDGKIENLADYEPVRRPLGELLRSAKPVAAKNAPGRKRKKPGEPIDPRYAWSDERRAAAKARRFKAILGEGSEADTILEVKEPPEPAKPAAKPKQEDIDGFAGIIYLGHALLAQMWQIPELHQGMDPQKSKELSVATMNVLRHYSSGLLSEKTQDWIKLGMVAGATYVPIFATAGARVRAEKATKAKTPPAGMNMAGGYQTTSPISEGDESDG